jgi:Peptidase M50B-like
MDELIGVPVVGAPVVAGAGFIVLLLTVFAYEWPDLILSVVHEGGHMVMSVLTFRGFRSFSILGTGNAVTRLVDGSWGVGDFISRLAGYLAPPLLGLGGAAVLARGNAWGVLVIAAILMFAAFLYASGGLANVVTLVAFGGILLLLWRGSAYLQLTVAVAIVWLLLIGGVVDAVRMGRTGGADAAVMARRTWIPALVWQAFWVTVALVCLYAGGRLLFTGTAWPAGVWPFDVRA